VLSSTGGAIYGDAAVLPTPESEAPNPISAYGLAKWASERYGQWFSCTSGINVIALRYGNVYGPRQGASGESGVVAQFCVVAANIAAAGLRATPYGEYNVGSGREVTILQLARMVREASGVKPGSRAVCFEKARAGEVRHSCLDVSRIRRDLDLPPPVPLASGIERTLEWACAASLDSCGKSA
jgi:UDP-glucose 4-epimerase